jgi:hypothetical protein
MRDSDSNSETVVNRSREISEDRWVSIKNELEEAKGTFTPEIEPCSPLVEAAKESARLTPLRRDDF